MIQAILENWQAALIVMGGISILIVIGFACLIVWKKLGGGDIKAGPVDIDVDGKQ